MNDINDSADSDSAEAAPLAGLTPLALVARLHADGAISNDERDAAEIVARMAAFLYSRPAADGATHIPMRSDDGRWSNPLLRGQDIKARLASALAGVKTDSRRKAVTLALVARERDFEWPDTSALSCGLEDLARHFWPRAAAETMNKNGVTLVKTGPDDATPERLRHANDNTINDEGVRRIIESPFARMHARLQLDRDPGINEILFSAGRNYYQDWYYGGLNGLVGIDYESVGSGGRGQTDPMYMMPRTEHIAERRLRFRKARAALGDRYRPVVDAIVLYDGTTSSVAEAISGYKHLATGRAIVAERLNTALRRLSVFYGLMQPASSAA